MNLAIAASHSDNSRRKASNGVSAPSKFAAGEDSKVGFLTAKFEMGDVGTKIFSCRKRFCGLAGSQLLQRESCHKEFKCLRFQVANKIL